MFTSQSHKQHFTHMSSVFFFLEECLLSTVFTQVCAACHPHTKVKYIYFKGNLGFSFASTHCSLIPKKEEFCNHGELSGVFM